ncbi:hypothetical protein Tco_0454753 [Tanacetum coccineum]
MRVKHHPPLPIIPPSPKASFHVGNLTFSMTLAESMARIGFKEAQLLSMAGIKVLKSLTEETQERRAEDVALSINRRLCEPNS